MSELTLPEITIPYWDKQLNYGLCRDYDEMLAKICEFRRPVRKLISSAMEIAISGYYNTTNLRSISPNPRQRPVFDLFKAVNASLVNEVVKSDSLLDSVYEAVRPLVADKDMDTRKAVIEHLAQKLLR